MDNHLPDLQAYQSDRHEIIIIDWGMKSIKKNPFFSSYTHDIEAVSCDEMLVDLTDLVSNTGVQPLQFASILRHEVKDKTGCNSSAGLGELF